MGLDEFTIERTHFVITQEGLFDGGVDAQGIVPAGACVLDGNHQKFGSVTRGQPIHYGGASAHLSNLSGTTIRVSLQDSDDGVTWSVLLFSDAGTANLISRQIVGLSQCTIDFVTARRYIMISHLPLVGEGVVVDITQHPPRGEAREAGY